MFRRIAAVLHGRYQRALTSPIYVLAVDCIRGFATPPSNSLHKQCADESRRSEHGAELSSLTQERWWHCHAPCIRWIDLSLVHSTTDGCLRLAERGGAAQLAHPHLQEFVPRVARVALTNGSGNAPTTSLLERIDKLTSRQTRVTSIVVVRCQREVLLPDLLIRIDDSAFAWCNATVCAREDAIVAAAHLSEDAHSQLDLRGVCVCVCVCVWCPKAC
jgi:hypothetical protein